MQLWKTLKDDLLNHQVKQSLNIFVVDQDATKTWKCLACFIFTCNEHSFFCANDQCEKADELSAGAGGGFECKYQYANYKDNLKEFHALPATVVNFSYNINIVT